MSTSTAQIPASVTLTQEEHDNLVAEMMQHRQDAARAAVRAEAARNALLVGWAGWIDRQSARSAPTTDAAADRAGEARVRAIAAIDAFDPARGLPLHRWLRTSHAVHGEAVAQAGMPLTVGTARQRREDARNGSPVTMSSTSGSATEDGNDLVDNRPDLSDGPDVIAETSERARMVTAAVAATGGKTADILSRFYGLGGHPRQTAAQIADELDTTVAAVEMRLTRGRAAITRRSSITDLRN